MSQPESLALVAEKPSASGRTLTVTGAPVPRVDFLIVGAMKCATSTVKRVLASHPDVHMPERETHFFGSHRRYLSVWRDGRLDGYALERAYGRHLHTRRAVVGDKTPNYMASALVVERIQRFHPQAKVVVMVRDPVDRARSHWDHLQRQVAAGRMSPHRVAPTLGEHVLRNSLELERVQRPDVEVSGTNILWRGFYAVQIRTLRRFFPADRLFIGVLDDLRSDSVAFYRRLHAFLGLSGLAECPTLAAHTTPPDRRRVLSRLEEHALREYYAESVADLETVLGRDLTAWRR